LALTVRLPELSDRSVSAKDDFAVQTNFAVSSTEFPFCLLDQRQIFGKYPPKSVWLFVHNVLMAGSPRTGKTLLARALPGILPEMSIEESLDVTRIFSVADQLPAGTPLIKNRPFRSPHHTISHAGLVGGGNIPKPGEISLAHRGVLFLDEFPEFGTRVLEVMRQPMEDKVVTISRTKGSLTFPANFQLISAMNPCPCGYFGDTLKPCTCAPATITNTRSVFPVPCWIGSIFISRSHAWTMKN